ncbi:carbohydrate esterase [Thraustotheca clavata]|uniref:Carbohydrate esterase n=1 Tax=Thraustotheca clavata TaxID=74557 RepID=A0A1V9ZZY6_9STRA|nr:carbohydrate esterase [Thraustotheca clavata]
MTELEVYNFDVSKYKDGAYRLVTAVDPLVHLSGRFLRHGEAAVRKTKVNSVQFDWPHCGFSIHVAGATTVAIRLKGEGNYFNVFVDGNFRCILRASLKATCCEVAHFDDNDAHLVTVTKRTEPQMRGAVSTFKVCTFYGFIVDRTANVLPFESTYTRKIEFIGDSDTCGFGNEGAASHNKAFFGMKGRMENVYNAYPCITARMFNAEAHVLAWSGKGVHSNSVDWGPNMSAMWKNTIASREGTWGMTSWMPDAVVINLGGQDLFPPASSEAEIVGAYTSLLEDVRLHRPDAHIFCVVCDENCTSGEEDETNRCRISLQLQEITKVAMSRVRKRDERLHYCFIRVPGGMENSDFANMRHYAVSGHVKFAQALAKEIAFRTEWSIENDTVDMVPYPPDKKDILVPEKGANCVIC